LCFRSQRIALSAYTFAENLLQGVLPMPPRLKRLIGACLIVLFVVVYAFVASLVGSGILAGKPAWVQILYFPVAGLLWIFPVGALIVWMYRKPA